MILTRIFSAPATSWVTETFSAWIATYCTPQTYALDVGAGYDLSKIDVVIQPRVMRLVGVDSSEDILRNPSVHEGYQSSLEAFANTTQEQFDIIFCTMVLEHVDNPEAFLMECRKLLKTGGMFFAITPNEQHYFGFLTKLTTQLGINEWLLDVLVGKKKKESYHFPTIYKINNIGVIQRTLERAGFQAVEFQNFDNWQEFCYVVPPPFRWLSRLYSRFVYRFGLVQNMGKIMFRATN